MTDTTTTATGDVPLISLTPDQFAALQSYIAANQAVATTEVQTVSCETVQTYCDQGPPAA